MKILCHGDVLQDNQVRFTSVASIDDTRLLVTFEGILRVDNPYRHLHHYLEELERVLPQHTIAHVTLDFVQLVFSNDNCIYVIMDIVDCVYRLLPCTFLVKQREGDEWQAEAIPILINLPEAHIAQRTTFEKCAPGGRA